MKRTLKEEYLGKDKGGLGYFQMGGGIKKNSLYNKKNGKPSRDPGIAALRETKQPVEQDLEDAVDFLRFEVDNFKLKISDFDLKYLGKLTVDELYQYDDLSGWLEMIDDDDELTSFRGKSFYDRSLEWGDEPPPIIIGNIPGKYTAIADGRGRVNYAKYKNIPLDTYMITLKDKINESNILDHLKDRHVDFNKTKVITDLETNQATFILYNLSGQLIGYQKYNPKGSKDYRNTELGKYFTHVTKNPDRNIAVWGLESIDERPFMFVVEGIFDAIRLHNLGLPAIAVLANHPTALRSWLKAISKTIIAVLDNDEAGNQLKSIAHQSIKVPDPYKDLGEMKSEEEILEWLKTHFDWL